MAISDMLTSKLSMLTAIAAVCVSLSGMAKPTLVQAQTGLSAGTTVMVIGDDSEAGSIRRSSGLYREVAVALQTQMARHGFDVLDAEWAGAGIGYRFRDRTPRTELFQLYQTLSRTNPGTRALVMFRLHASVQQQTYSSRLQTRVVGEVYDGASGRFVNSFSLPPETIPGPADCADQLNSCIDMVIRPRAGDIAANLGDVLAVQLSNYMTTETDVAVAPPPAPIVQGAVAPPGDMIGAGSPLCANDAIRLTMELRNFDTRTAHLITEIMDTEFPCRLDMDLLTGSNNVVRRYAYTTVAELGRIEEWTHILLSDMGYDTDREVRVSVLADGVVRIDRIVP